MDSKEKWDNLYRTGTGEQLYPSEQVIRLIRKLYPNPENQDVFRILDLGCGNGRNLQPLKDYFTKAIIWAVDISDVVSDIKGERVRPLQCSAEKLQFDDEQFDLVVDDGCLHHLQDPEKGWAEATRVLKLGGKLLCGHMGTYSEWPGCKHSTRKSLIENTLWQDIPKTGPEMGIPQNFVMDRCLIDFEDWLSSRGLNVEYQERTVRIVLQEDARYSFSWLGLVRRW